MAKYTITVDGEIVAERARKDAAVKHGESLGVSFTVQSPSGQTVHEHEVPAEQPNQEESDAPAPEEAAQEDLIGSAPASEPGDDEFQDVKPDAERKFDVDAMKRKISALLAKAERTDNEDERDAFTKKAERLMLRLGIQAAELEAAGEVKAEEIVQEVIPFTGIYAVTMIEFVHRTANGFGNLTVLQSSGGQRRRFAWVIGHKSDVEAFKVLLTSLTLQGHSALKRFQKAGAEDRAWMDAQNKFVQDRSFLIGFAAEVSRRLAVLRTETEAEASTGAALVLASKMDRIGSWMDENHGDVKAARGGNKQFSSRSAAAGREAGKSASLGEKSVGGTKGEIK